MSNIHLSTDWQGTALEWCRLKAGGKRYERWKRIRPNIDPVGDNREVRFRAKFRARQNNRDLRRQCGADSAIDR